MTEYCDITDQIEEWREAEKSKNPPSAYKLVELIHKISEEYFFAGWLSGIELVLLETLENDNREEWLTQEDFSELKALAQDAGGFWKFDYEDPQPIFVPVKRIGV